MRRLAIALLLSMLAACASVPGAAGGVTFVLVRHAEKADGGQDPGLTAAGEKRAARLARHLRRAPVVAVYSTAWQRARATAAPTARDHALTVTVYDPARPAADFAAMLRQRHPQGTVLVVGHGNTVPALAEALCDCWIAPIGEADYGRRITVRIAPDGTSTVDDRSEP